MPPTKSALGTNGSYNAGPGTTGTYGSFQGVASGTSGSLWSALQNSSPSNAIPQPFSGITLGSALGSTYASPPLFTDRVEESCLLLDRLNITDIELYTIIESPQSFHKLFGNFDYLWVDTDTKYKYVVSYKFEKNLLIFTGLLYIWDQELKKFRFSIDSFMKNNDIVVMLQKFLSIPHRKVSLLKSETFQAELDKEKDMKTSWVEMKLMES